MLKNAGQSVGQENAYLPGEIEHIVGHYFRNHQTCQTNVGQGNGGFTRFQAR